MDCFSLKTSLSFTSMFMSLISSKIVKIESSVKRIFVTSNLIRPVIFYDAC
jgi:hypothetical protein